MGKAKRQSLQPGQHLPSGVITVLFTDIVDSTKLKRMMEGETSARRDAAFQTKIKQPHDTIVLDRVRAHDGFLINPTGDGFCFAFSDAEEAVICAVEIQERIAAHAFSTPLGSLNVRIGLNTGIAKASETCFRQDYINHTSDKAARVQAKAQGGQVILSRETHALVDAKIRGISFDSIGRHELKGLGWEDLFIVFREQNNLVAKVAHKYFRYIIHRFGKLTLYSTTSEQPLAVDLEQVFVPLSTFQRIATRALGERIAYGFWDKQPIPQNWKEHHTEKHQHALARSNLEESSLTLSVPEAIRLHHKIVIVGAPGAGKTTLLKWLALTFARRQAKKRLQLHENRLPLFIALRDFNRFLDRIDAQERLPSPLPASLLVRHLVEYHTEHVQDLDLPADFFQRALTQGRCLLLIDGLDEVADAGKRARAADFVATCIRRYNSNRFVITSRPRGYEADCRAILSPLCGECQLREFTDDIISAFARNWYLAVTVAREGNNLAARNKAKANALDLLRAVQVERVRPLAATPLLLSVLALIHQRGVGLPQRRVELYDECVEFLLGYWDQIRGGEAARELANVGGLTRADKRKLLEPVALWIHERGTTGTEVQKSELVLQLMAQFEFHYGISRPQARLRATEFVHAIVERAGLLIEREADTFAFSHHTFQEYLAACALSDETDFVRVTMKHLHDPWWREVILLQVAHLSSPMTRRSRELTSQILIAIRDAESWSEEILRRDLLFTFRGLCEIGELGVDEALRRGVTNEICRLWQTTKSSPIANEIRHHLFPYAAPTPLGLAVLEFILPLAQSADPEMRYRTALALGWFGSASPVPIVLDKLAVLSQDEKDNVRVSAAFALSHMASDGKNARALQLLVALAQDRSGDVREVVHEELGTLGAKAATPEVVELLLKMAKQPEDRVRFHAVESLGCLGPAAATSRVIDLLEKLSKDSEYGMRGRAAWAFGTLGLSNQKVLRRLNALSNDPSDQVRSDAALALSRLGENAATRAVIKRMLTLTHDQHDDPRRNAIRALSRFGPKAATPCVLQRLVDLSQHDDDFVRSGAADALNGLATPSATPIILGKLLDLSKESNQEIRLRALDALGRFDAAGGNQAALKYMLVSSQDSNEEVRYTAVKALCRLDDAFMSSVILKRMVVLSKDPNTSVRSQVADRLGRLHSRLVTPEILMRILALSLDSEEHVRSNAVDALANQASAGVNPTILKRLILLTRDPDCEIRLNAAWALGQCLFKLNLKTTDLLAAFWKHELEDEEGPPEFFGGEERDVSDFAFEELKRLATRRAQLMEQRRSPSQR